MRVIVVEPHPDDAFLCLGAHLESLWAEHERTILTVYADAKRTKEAHAYATAIGAKSVVLGLTESKMNSDGPITCLSELKDLRALVGDIDPGSDLVLFPLGLQHPDHKRVAVSRPNYALRYLDTPYQLKQKLAEELQSKIEGFSIESILYPSKRKWEHIPIFKSQSMFFHYNDTERLRGTPELVLRKIPD